jgi:hypothetical protein
MKLVKNKHVNNPRNVALREWCNEVRGRGVILAKRLFPGTEVTSVSTYKYGEHKISDELQAKIDLFKVQIEKEEKALKIKKRRVSNTSSCMHAEHRSEKSGAANKRKLFEECMKDNKFMDFYKENSKYYKETNVDLLSYVNNNKDIPIDLYISLRITKKRYYSGFYSNKDVIKIMNDWINTPNYIQKKRLFNVVFSLNYTKTKLLTVSRFDTIINNNKDRNFNTLLCNNVLSTIQKVDQMIAENNRFALAAL